MITEEKFATLDDLEHAFNEYVEWCSEPVDFITTIAPSPPGNVHFSVTLFIPSMPGHSPRLLFCVVPIQAFLEWEIPDFIEVREFKIDTIDLQQLLADTAASARLA